MALGDVNRDVTRTNPTPVAINTLQKTAQVSIFKAVLSGANDAAALSTDAIASRITDELGSHGMMLQVKTGGLQILIVGDSHAVDLNSIASRIGHILDTSAGSITSAGVYTCGGGGTVTVTEPTTLYGL